MLLRIHTAVEYAVTPSTNSNRTNCFYVEAAEAMANPSEHWFCYRGMDGKEYAIQTEDLLSVSMVSPPPSTHWKLLYYDSDRRRAGTGRNGVFPLDSIP